MREGREREGWRDVVLLIFFFLVFKWTHSRSELKGLLQYERLYDTPEETNLWLQLFKGMNNKIIIIAS